MYGLSAVEEEEFRREVVWRVLPCRVDLLL